MYIGVIRLALFNNAGIWKKNEQIIYHWKHKQYELLLAKEETEVYLEGR